MPTKTRIRVLSVLPGSPDPSLGAVSGALRVLPVRYLVRIDGVVAATWLVIVSGELDGGSVDLVEACLARLPGADVGAALDLSAVPHATSSGLAGLIRLIGPTDVAARPLRLVRPHRGLLELFEFVGIRSLLTIDPDARESVVAIAMAARHRWR